MVACARGAWGQAIAHSLEALARARESGDMWSRAKALVTLAEAEAGGGDYRAARRNFAEAITIGINGLGAAHRDRRLGRAGEARRAGRREYGAADHPGACARPRRDTIPHRQTRHAALGGARAAGRPPTRWPISSSRPELDRARRAGPPARRLCGGPRRRCAGPRAARIAPAPRRRRTARGISIVETGATLSAREIEVLQLLIAGANNQSIADALTISPYTVKHHVASILSQDGRGLAHTGRAAWPRAWPRAAERGERVNGAAGDKMTR